MQFRECPKCKVQKTLESFAKNKRKPSGYNSWCKQCTNQWAKDNQEIRSQKVKAYYEANKEEILEYKKNWHYLKRYNLTLEELLTMKVEQNSRCKICGKHESETPRKSLCVDHDHTTGKVRGLLCESCNQGLGLFYDNPDNLKNALEYLLSQT